MAYPTPTKPGFYWAKWKIVEEGTMDEDSIILACAFTGDSWEVVDVFANGIDPKHPRYWLVHVSGVAKPQSIENFYWGPGPLKEPT